MKIYCDTHEDKELVIIVKCGITYVEPCPICIEDAIDAAIDGLKFDVPDPGRWDPESL